MKKRATGLTSVPASSVPGSEDVEVNSLESEDIEAGNHGGFNQVDPSEFSVLMNIINKESANYNFHNIKVSNEMKEELIKLNKALNGLGYKNLIKMAQDKGPISNNKLKEGALYIYFDNTFAVKCIQSPPEVKNTYVKVVWIKPDEGGSPRDSIITRTSINNTNYNERFFIGKLYELRDTEKVPDGMYKEPWYEISEEYLNSLRNPGETNAMAAATGVTPTTPGTASTSSTPSNSTRRPYKTNSWEKYVAKDDSPNGERHQIQLLWNRFADSKENDGYNRTYESYRGWWIDNFKNKQKQGHTDEVITELKKLTEEPIGNAAATGADTSPQPAATPQSTATSAASSVSETVNGESAVSIGTRGGDQIYLILKSLDEGKPKLYRKDSRTGTVKQMTPGESIQFRNSLSNLEINRIERSLARIPEYQAKAKYFSEFMKLQRRDNRFGRFRTKGREAKMDAKMEGARSGMSQMPVASARQSRLDSLKKKGII